MSDLPEFEAAPDGSWIVHFDSAIDEAVATEAITRLLYLLRADSRHICLQIDSPGGDINASLALLDVLREYSSRIWTRCTKRVAGSALILLAAGMPGRRVVSATAVLKFSPLSGQPAKHVEDAGWLLADCLNRVSNLDRLEAHQMMNESRLVSPKEALRMKLIDLID